jgi:hypothetical protein
VALGALQRALVPKGLSPPAAGAAADDEAPVPLAPAARA